MNVLVLGGTQFLGRHVVDATLRRGHAVTMFNRGRTNPIARHGVAELRGDRDDDAAALKGLEFDLVIDTSAYHPRHVELVASTLAKPGRYILISTASVYCSFPAAEASLTQDAICDPEARVSPSTYGALKRGCEESAARAFGDRACIVRPGVLIGPYDSTNRFSYWVSRAAEGGEMLAPGDPDRTMQLLDARDLAAWLVDPVVVSSGVFNVAGPDGLTMRAILSSCVASAGTDARMTWVADTFLLERGLVPWRDIPLWLPQGADSALQLDTSRARAAAPMPPAGRDNQCSPPYIKYKRLAARRGHAEGDAA
jgi:2'-hydroxyisoflavone reductase